MGSLRFYYVWYVVNGMCTVAMHVLDKSRTKLNAYTFMPFMTAYFMWSIYNRNDGKTES